MRSREPDSPSGSHSIPMVVAVEGPDGTAVAKEAPSRKNHRIGNRRARRAQSRIATWAVTIRVGHGSQPLLELVV